MQQHTMEEIMRQVFGRLASELLYCLKGVALARGALAEEGYVIENKYAMEEWARLPETIAEAVSCLIHCTYSDDELTNEQWHRWRTSVRDELERNLRECGPVRIIK